MVLYNFASSGVTCRGFVHQERSHAIDTPGRVLPSRREEMQYLLHTLKLEVLEEALLEGRRRIDTQFGAHNRFQRHVTHLGRTLRLVLPETGVAGAAIGPAR